MVLMTLSPSDMQEGADILLLPKNAEFLLGIHRIVSADPHYLFFHSSSCGHEVRKILWKESLYVPTADDAIAILEEALRRYAKSDAA